MRFVRRAALRDEALNDPLASTLTSIGRACTGRGMADVPRFLAADVYAGSSRRAALHPASHPRL